VTTSIRTQEIALDPNDARASCLVNAVEIARISYDGERGDGVDVDTATFATSSTDASVRGSKSHASLAKRRRRLTRKQVPARKRMGGSNGCTLAWPTFAPARRASRPRNAPARRAQSSGTT